MEKVRSDFAMETEAHCGGGGVLVDLQSRGPTGSSTNPLNFSLRNWGTEIRYRVPGVNDSIRQLKRRVSKETFHLSYDHCFPLLNLLNLCLNRASAFVHIEEMCVIQPH